MSGSGSEYLYKLNAMVSDTGQKDERGNPVLDPRYGFHALRCAAASLFIQYQMITPSGFRLSWVIRQ
jgi:hypothetical protein